MAHENRGPGVREKRVVPRSGVSETLALVRCDDVSAFVAYIALPTSLRSRDYIGL